jgi:hypothetical protein
MANVNFMTIIDKRCSDKPGADEEADEVMVEFINGEIGKKMVFSPFIFLRAPEEKLCSFEKIEKHSFDIGSPPEIPKLKWPQAPEVRTGVVLETMKIGKRSITQASGFAYLRVDSHGERTFIDSENRPITHSQNYPDSAFNTETKLKTRILRMLQTWHGELLSNYEAWQEELAQWRTERARWELDLAKRMNDAKIITLSKEDFEELEITKKMVEPGNCSNRCSLTNWRTYWWTL